MHERIVTTISQLEQIFSEVPCPIVVDNSAIVLRLSNPDRGVLDNTEFADSSKMFFEWLGENLPDNVTFPDETREEFRYSTSRLIRCVRRSITRMDRKARGGKFSNGRERIFMSRQKKEEIREDLRVISSLASLRKSLEKNKFRKKRTESYFPKEFDICLDEWPLYHAVLDIAKRPGIIRSYTGEEPRFCGDDEKIFAKCLAISYEQPVVVLTCDTDFKRMQRNFYLDEPYLSKKYHFDFPEHCVFVIQNYFSNITVAHPCGKIIPFRRFDWTNVNSS